MMKSSPLFQRLPLNVHGRDLVIGDVHGCFELVFEAMRVVKFDPDIDRLISVGDLIDRGPDSAMALDFLKQPFVHALRGNHESMLLEAYDNGTPHQAVTDFMFSRNGMQWLKELSHEQRQIYVDSFAELPIAIEVETRRGSVGFVHADVPYGLTWQEFVEVLESEMPDPKILEAAVWARDRISDQSQMGVRGIDRVFVGHTPVVEKTRLGNVYFVDTGAVFGWKAQDGEKGRMTFTDLTVGTGIFATAESPYRKAMLDILVEPSNTTEPFGCYSR